MSILFCALLIGGSCGVNPKVDCENTQLFLIQFAIYNIA